jgi:transposase
MKKQVKLNKANMQARRNITYHVGNMAERENMTVQQAARTFRASVMASQTSLYLSEAAHSATPGEWPPSEKNIIRWVRQWQRNKPKGQTRKPVKTRTPRIDPGKVAVGRKRVLEYILARRKQRQSTISAEIKNFQERLRFHRLAPDVQEAAKDAHAAPGSKTDISISRGTLYSWLQSYENSGYDIDALVPKKTAKQKKPYANDNSNRRSESK